MLDASRRLGAAVEELHRRSGDQELRRQLG